MVKLLVNFFIAKAVEITGKYNNKVISTNSNEKEDENSVAKLFEEVKIMFDSLPSKIENKLDPESRKRKRKFHPMMLEEIMHFSFAIEDSNLGFLIFIGLYKEDIPWFYELGLETYRGIKASKSNTEKERLIKNFAKVVDMLGSPLIREFYGESKESYYLLKEARRLIHRFFERFDAEKNEKE